MAARLEAGQLVWGMPLASAARPEQGCVLEHLPDLVLARTAVGDFLLVSGELVDPEVHAAALTAVTGQEATA